MITSTQTNGNGIPDSGWSSGGKELTRADVIIFVFELPCIFWRYINVDEVSLITLKNLLQSAMELLQIATA